MYSINVLLITYNQEKLVGKAIESVLIQKDYGLNQLIVLDDCSTDHNWDVIQEYQKKYPEFVVPYRNETNIGKKSLYQNFWKLYTLRGNADLYCFLSGDDSFCDGWFHAVQDLIRVKDIDVIHKAVAVFGDDKIVFPNGKTIISGHARLIENGLDIRRMRVRGMGAASSIMTKAVMEKYQKPILDEGLCLAEAMFDNNKYYCCDDAYYCNVIGHEYHVGIGVSKSIASRNDYYLSLIHAIERSMQLYQLCDKDMAWSNYRICRLKYTMTPTLKKYFKMLTNYGKAFDWTYNKITFKEDLKWFLFDAMRPAVKRMLGINKQNTEPKAISV